MSFISNERSKLQHRLRGIQDHLDDLGSQGQYVSQKVISLRNALRETDEEEIHWKFQRIKVEMDIFREKNVRVTLLVTQILTDIRYGHLTSHAVGGLT
jgi:hypothetical protein